MTDTEAAILAENGGDLQCAFSDACRLYDRVRRLVSAGYLRADTSKMEWNPKTPPAITDEWIGTVEKPE